MRFLWRRTIWHPAAIPVEEFKYRHLKRVWLPVFDLIAVYCGAVALVWGAPLLDSLLPATAVNLYGAALLAVGAVSLVGDVIPKLWYLVAAARPLLVGLILSFATMVLLHAGESDQLNFFITGILIAGMPMALFHISLLGEEYKERRQRKGSVP